jgi:REP element-mobilizing transposase RayT
LQHVIARGIERTKIFRDDKDRKSFLERFADVLEAAQTQCYAWALIPNHFHALLRTGATPLSKVMRRLMTGYAVTFNKRHKRSGHLFQNRYKSIVCEEDPYLLELLRYIHVNPLRAGLVKDLKGLDNHPWTGHSVLLGKRKNPLIPKPPDQARNKWAIRNRQSEMSLAERTTQDVLLHFGESVNIARREYREFVEKGIDQGRRPELQGGGLVRSAGGDKRGLLGRKKEEREKGDERILGSGDFVADALQKAGKSFEAKQSRRPPLKALIDIASEAFGVSAKQLKSGSRRRAMVQARSVVAYVAVRRYGYKGFEVAEALASSSPSVSRNIEKGEFILDNNKELKIEFPVT